MRILTTIAFRKGSKRLPLKNIRPLLGKPLWRWTFNQALEWKEAAIYDIAICTDFAKHTLGDLDAAYWIERPPELSTDRVPKMDVLRHILREMESRQFATYDAILDLDVTNPMREIYHISDCVALAAKNNMPVVSAVASRRSPYTNMIEKLDDFQAIVCRQAFIDPVSCADFLPTIYELNCCIYVYPRWFLDNPRHKTPLYSKVCYYEMPTYTRFDTDTEEDWVCMEAMMKKYGYAK